MVHVWFCSLELPASSGWHSAVGSSLFEVVMYIVACVAMLVLSLSLI